MSAAAAFSSRYCRRLVPGIGTISRLEPASKPELTVMVYTLCSQQFPQSVAQVPNSSESFRLENAETDGDSHPVENPQTA
jgi:hypothetical protein